MKKKLLNVVGLLTLAFGFITTTMNNVAEAVTREGQYTITNVPTHDTVYLTVTETGKPAYCYNEDKIPPKDDSVGGTKFNRYDYYEGMNEAIGDRDRVNKTMTVLLMGYPNNLLDSVLRPIAERAYQQALSTGATKEKSLDDFMRCSTQEAVWDIEYPDGVTNDGHTPNNEYTKALVAIANAFPLDESTAKATNVSVVDNSGKVINDQNPLIIDESTGKSQEFQLNGDYNLPISVDNIAPGLEIYNAKGEKVTYLVPDEKYYAKGKVADGQKLDFKANFFSVVDDNFYTPTSPEDQTMMQNVVNTSYQSKSISIPVVSKAVESSSSESTSSSTSTEESTTTSSESTATTESTSTSTEESTTTSSESTATTESTSTSTEESTTTSSEDTATTESTSTSTEESTTSSKDTATTESSSTSTEESTTSSEDTATTESSSTSTEESTTTSSEDTATTESKEETKVVVSKQDIVNKEEIAGAHLQVTDKNGKVVEEWVSKKGKSHEFTLADGEYTLTETQAPNGYEVAESINFTVKNGKVLVNGKEVNQVVMYDKREEKTSEKTTVVISKQDVAGNEIAGAHLQVTDKNGNVVEEWVSEEGKSHEFALADGEYTLTETQAPAGFEIAESINFTVKDGKVLVNGKEVDKVVMVDKAKTTEGGKQIIVKDNNGGGSSNGTNGGAGSTKTVSVGTLPQTGNKKSTGLVVAGASLVAVAAIVAFVVYRKKAHQA